MRILAIDQSLTHSAAVLLNSNNQGTSQPTIAEQFVHRPKSSGIFRIAGINVWFTTLVETYRPSILVRELHNMRAWGAANAIHAVNGFIDAVALERDYLDNAKYFMIPPGVWKKFCLGKGNIAKDTAYLVHVNKFLSANKLIKVAEDFTVLDDNIADAICLGVTAYYAYRYLRGDEDLCFTASQTKVIKDNCLKMMDYGKS